MAKAKKKAVRKVPKKRAGKYDENNLHTKEIFVNQILEEDHITRGLAVLNKTVLENLKIMYPPDKLQRIAFLAKQSPEGVYFFDRYFQYIVFVQLDITVTTFEGAMYFIDCKNNTDIALTEYLEYQKKGWEVGNRTQFMNKFQEILHDKSGVITTMVIKDPFEEPSFKVT